MDYSFNFTRKNRNVLPNAAIEATSVNIPFEDEMHLQNSGGITDKCFFLKDKNTGELYEWNEAMAADGRTFFLPHYDVRLLEKPEWARYKQVLIRNGKIKQVELENLNSVAVSQSAVAAVVRQVESGDVKPEFIDEKALPGIQGDLMSDNVSKVVEAAKRGRKPKEVAVAA